MSRFIILTLLAAAIALGGCDSRSQQSSGGSDGSDTATPVDSAKKTDQLAAEDLAKSKLPAKQWLADTSHGTFKATKADIIKFTDESLAAGAVGVWVSGPEEYEGKQLIDHLFIELPTDAAKRQKLIEIYNKASEDEEKDVGQKFLAFDWG